MITAAVIDFVSRECKHGIHQRCYGKWKGLGFEIVCNCKCGHKKDYEALGSVEGPLANAADSSFKERTENEDI